MKPTILCSLLTLAIGMCPAHAAENSKFSVTAGLSSFLWEEFKPSGEKILSETGPIGSVKVSVDSFNRRNAGMLFNLSGSLYYGLVDYDGQTQSGIKATTEVKYNGLAVEYKLGHRFNPSKYSPFIDLYGAAGLDDWERKIYNGRTADGRIARGYTENYRVVYSKIGAGFAWNMKTKDQLRFAVEAKRPIVIKEEFDLYGGIDLEPKPSVSIDASIEYDHHTPSGTYMTFSLYGASYRFEKSPAIKITSGGLTYSIHQPESHMTMYGIRASFNF